MHVSDEMVARAAKALEKRVKQSKYAWSDDQFEIWWNTDSRFVQQENSWGDAFGRGTEKDHLQWKVRIALEAALSHNDDSTSTELLEALKFAAARVRLANAEGDPILSAWLPGADATIAKAENRTGGEVPSSATGSADAVPGTELVEVRHRAAPVFDLDPATPLRLAIDLTDKTWAWILARTRLTGTTPESVVEAMIQTVATKSNVEVPDGAVTVIDMGEAGGPPSVNHAPPLHQALEAAERFISGFECDDLQEGVDRLLADIRAAVQGRTDRQIIDETNALARYIMAELVGTGYQVPNDWRSYEETDPRSKKAWKHAVTIMEMITFTNAEDALSNLDPDEQDPESRFPFEDWQYEVANGDTRLGYEAWLEAKCSE